MKTDDVLRHEHRELLDSLESLAARSDSLGVDARRILVDFRPHMEKEEELVLPVLGVLGELAPFILGDDGKPVELTDTLSAKYRSLFEEHKGMLHSILKFRDSALKIGDQGAMELAENLMHHIELEESVLYPASLIALKYVESFHPARGRKALDA
ncbi:MAG: hemerythrin domain-containing protein [Thermoprotei archaeon]